MNKAVFLDRDGVINLPVLNPLTNAYEAPFHPEDYKLFPSVIDSLLTLVDLNYFLFLVSNQPDYAKGKTTLESLKAVHLHLHEILIENNIFLKEYYYCYHHPDGIIPEYSIKCECRKPGNLFLRQAKDRYDLDVFNSWMIGDRDTDVYCGKASGVKTILINQKYADGKAGKSSPDFKAEDLKQAVEIIKREMKITV